MARDRGDTATAKLRAEEGLALHRSLADVWGTAESLLLLGAAVADAGDFARARDLFEESGRLFGELGHQHDALVALNQLAWTYWELGDRERARATLEECLVWARTLGSQPMEAQTLGELAMYAAEEGRVHDALSLASESVRTLHDVGDRWGIATELCRCAGALALAGKTATAARLLAASEALFEEIGDPCPPHFAQENEKRLDTIRTQLGEAAFAEAWEQGRTLTADDAVALALDALE
jgi:tetratricopeptide (TPR) repeat protein